MPKLKRHFGAYLLLALLLINVVIWYAVFVEERGGKLTVAFLDVGQGDAIFIEAPNGNQMLIDGGPNKAVLRELSKVMPFYDRSIDVLMVSNPDADHIAGFVDVLQRFDVGRVIEPGTISTTGVYEALESEIEKEGAERIIAQRGMSIVLDEGVVLTILFPDRNVSGLTTNDGSIVARLTYGLTSVMFTGDTTQKIEEYLVHLDGNYLDSDVLKVAHHGSKTSTSELFLAAVLPSVAVVSAGKDNRYGHPHAAVTGTLKSRSIPFLNTANDGTVIFVSDGRSVVRRD